MHCDYSGKPAWAQNDAASTYIFFGAAVSFSILLTVCVAVAAYKEGSDYVFRTNDDTRFPVVRDWVDIFVQHLRSHMVCCRDSPVRESTCTILFLFYAAYRELRCCWPSKPS